ncbi:MAG: cytochrome c [Gemmatimonadales bacterium]|jgi:mono/diheme cytochrome c family protein|nr:cytochrome c [Gemmatimonadales bacterium]
MKTLSRLGMLVATLAVVAAAPAAAQGAAKLPAGVTPAMVEKGKAVWKGSGLCFACHGPEGKGAVGPNLTDAEWIHVKGGEYAGLVTVITKGITAAEAKTGKGPMPPKGGSQISDEDVKAVAAYVYTMSHK